jgi:predicted permease
MNVRQIRGWMARFFGMLNRGRREREFAEELESHLAMHIEDNLRVGMSPEEARRQALIKLGGATLTQELHREQRGLPMLETLLQDMRFGLRMLRKNPGFSFVAILTLALGIGANTAIFGVVDRLLVRALPVNEPQQLVNLTGRDEKGGEDTSFSYPIYADYRDQNEVFAGLLAFSETPLNCSEGGSPERILGVLVSGNFFDVLGVTPALGRTFLPEEDHTPGAHPVAVVSYGLWRRKFGADPKLVGRTITLNTHRFTVIGVAPAEFRGLRRGLSPDVYVPIQMIAQAWPGREARHLQSRGFSWLNLMGRLKPGVSRAQAEASMSALSSRIEKAHPNFTWPMIALADGSQGETGIISDWRTPLRLLLAMVALVLLIACVNIANLLLARAQTRSREMAVRLAVGASRARLIRQLLAESLLLSLAGGLLGLLMAVWISGLLAKYSPPAGSSAPPLLAAGLDGRALAFTLALSLLTSLLFGLAPALQASRPNLTLALKEETGGIGGWRLRRGGALVVGQIALSMILLISAGLCVRSLQKLQQIDTGFEAAQVLVMDIDLSLSGYTEEQGGRFYANLLERMAALPGVETASVGRIVPLGGNGMRLSVDIEGYTPPDGKPVNLDMNLVGPQYCATLKLPLLAGRDFTSADNRGTPRVVIINQAAARAYWPNQNPLGKYLSMSAPGEGVPQPVEIIGIVGDSRYRSLTESFRPGILLPSWQNYRPDLSLFLRSAGNPTTLVETARRELSALDPQLPITQIRTLAEQRRDSLYSQRATALLLVSFGGLALLLVALGMYGVMAYAVTQRTREMGIRLALGAQSGNVRALILRQGAWLIVAGLAMGGGGAWATTRGLKSFLYEVSATDPVTFVVVTALLCAAALLACWIPARRATKVDPLIALRQE